jgi:general L-amino acid transport system permease protein
METTEKTPEKQRLWHHPKFWYWTGQGLFLLGLGIILAICGSNLAANLQQGLGFNFLQESAGFNIGETLIPYQPTDTYGRALQVGIINSIRVMLLGIVLATVIGLTVGIMRLSSNWLLRQLATGYVEILRNTPLFLQLFVWYFAVFVSGPSFEQRFRILGDVSFSKRGLLLPNLLFKPSAIAWGICGLIGIMIAQWVWRDRARRRLERNELTQPWFMATVTFLFWLCMAWVFTKDFPVIGQWPRIDNNSVQAGLLLTPEYCALLFGLTFYTAAFIAEIVRGGILAIPKGQWEAGQALGFKSDLMLRLIILPQALRVIVPPLTSQYLNLAKNSSLGIAVGFPELYAVSSTTFNQTGRSIEVVLLLMAAYLSISLGLSLILNLYNRRLRWGDR